MMGRGRISSFDSDDCVPFLLSQIGQSGVHQGDVSTITSPCFQASRTLPHGSSLFSRLSRAANENSRQNKVTSECRLPSPGTSFDQSTIKLEDSLVERINENRPNRQRWNGQVSQQVSGESPGAGHPNRRCSSNLRHDNPKSTPTRKHNYAPSARTFGEIKNESPIPMERSVESVETDSANEVSSGMLYCGEVGRSVSWQVSPSKKHKHGLSETTTQCDIHGARLHSTPHAAKESQNQAIPCVGLDTSEISQNLTNSSKIKNEPSDGLDDSGVSSFLKRAKGRNRPNNAADEWKEVTDPETGRNYYYNRRTRASKWRLPKGSILVKKSSNLNLDRSRSADESQRKIPHHSPADINQEEHDSKLQDTYYSEESQLRMRQQSSISYSNESQLKIPHQSFGNMNHSQEEHESKLKDTYYSDENQLGMLQSSICHQARHQKDREPKLHDSYSDEERQGRGEHEKQLPGLQSSPRRLKHEIFEHDTRRVTSLKPALHLTPPQDCTTTDEVFCVYCGLKCESVAILGSHLTQCPQFSHTSHTTQIDLESMMFCVWSKIDRVENEPVHSEDLMDTAVIHNYQTVWDNTSYNLATSHESGQKVGKLALMLRKIGFDEYGPQTRTCHKESGEDNEKKLELTKKTPTRIRTEAHTEVSTNLFCIERKKCPFCEEVFVKGNEFSSHLLKCTERKRARKQRRRKKKESPLMADPRMKFVTPGRRMPWE